MAEYENIKHECEPRIPIFPLRYSVHPRAKDVAGDYTYAKLGLPLETGFKPLQHMQYDLRCVGSGFVYLFDETEKKIFIWCVNESDGTFTEIISEKLSLDALLTNYRTGNTLRWVWAKAKSRKP
jgi:hypothetical protein